MPEIIPLEAWIKLLDRLLSQAEASVTTGTAADRQTAREKILAFIKSTPAQYEFLDDIAREAVKNLNNASLDIAAGSIQKAANDLEKQRIIISLASAEAQKDAKDIKLEQLSAKIDEATKALDTLKDMNAILNNDDEAFIDKVKDIQAKLKALKPTT